MDSSTQVINHKVFMNLIYCTLGVSTGGPDDCGRCGKAVYTAEKIVGAGKVWLLFILPLHHQFQCWNIHLWTNVLAASLNWISITYILLHRGWLAGMDTWLSRSLYLRWTFGLFFVSGHTFNSHLSADTKHVKSKLQ